MIEMAQTADLRILAEEIEKIRPAALAVLSAAWQKCTPSGTELAILLEKLLDTSHTIQLLLVRDPLSEPTIAGLIEARPELDAANAESEREPTISVAAGNKSSHRDFDDDSVVVAAAIDDVVRYLRQRDDVVVPEPDGSLLVNGRFKMAPDELVERANRMRKRQGKLPYRLEASQHVNGKFGA